MKALSSSEILALGRRQVPKGLLRYRFRHSVPWLWKVLGLGPGPQAGLSEAGQARRTPVKSCPGDSGFSGILVFDFRNHPQTVILRIAHLLFARTTEPSSRFAIPPHSSAVTLLYHHLSARLLQQSPLPQNLCSTAAVDIYTSGEAPCHTSRR